VKKSLPSADDTRRLHFINALFDQVTGNDLYLAQQIKEGIAFSLGELEKQVSDKPETAETFDNAFNGAAAKLLEKFCLTQSERGFFHWDATKTLHSSTLLFARSEIMEGLKHLAHFKDSTLLVTNLRPALLPDNRMKTSKRKREYMELLSFIRGLAAERTKRNSDLQLIFL
jgi:hypothetical protein